MHLGMQLTLEPRLEQELELTMEMRQKLEDPVETARRLFEESKKVNVPINIGRYTIIVRAALISGKDLESLFEGESFAGMIARFDEKYQFINKNVQVPSEIAHVGAKLMAFHCLAAIRVPSFGDDTGTLKQYQATALEFAYARTILRKSRFSVYEEWRPTVERSDFFERNDWQEVVGKTTKRFRDIAEDMHRNAHSARFAVMMQGDEFRLTAGGAVNQRGEMVPVHRKIRHSRKKVR